jgi:hypothetical protein
MRIEGRGEEEKGKNSQEAAITRRGYRRQSDEIGDGRATSTVGSLGGQVPMCGCCRQKTGRAECHSSRHAPGWQEDGDPYDCLAYARHGVGA